jgi:NhaA family Na+:H+ antiporter
LAAAAHNPPTRLILGVLPVEALPGAILVAVAALAMVIVNSPLGGFYKDALAASYSVGPTGGGVAMSLAYWIKNGLMAIFFFFVGLELKRELMEGQLSNPAAAVLPMMGAAGGMAAPALIFVALAGPAGFGHGWAIPAATDIAFALGVLSLLGNRVPPALKAFLLAVAVVDDLGAILIVAFFYTERVLMEPLLAAGGVVAVLVAMNRLRVRSVGLYVLVGIVLWTFMLKSGVSPTIAGVLVAACVPLAVPGYKSPLHQAEHDFRPWVMYGVMPVFAFANAGVSLAGAERYLLHPVTLGCALGLLIGKPLGITALSWIGARLMKARMPGTLLQIVGVACIAGIGFTMSLFIGALAFKDPALQTPVRLGVYAGSIGSAVLGVVILSMFLPKALSPEDEAVDAEIDPFLVAEENWAAGDRS